MSVPGSDVDLEDAQTGHPATAPLDELEPDGPDAGRSQLGFPLVRVTNMGRLVTVDLSPSDDGDRYLFSYRSRQVGELRRLATDGDGPVEWRLALPNRPEVALASHPSVPPIAPALFFVDGALASSTVDL
jgi:hypothetical protein